VHTVEGKLFASIVILFEELYNVVDFCRPGRSLYHGPGQEIFLIIGLCRKT
jgi:lipoate-protein ligase B